MAWRITILPEPEEITLTLGQFLDSIELNGLKQITGAYLRGPDGNTVHPTEYGPSVWEIETACAMGQSALNLQVDYEALVRAINTQFQHNHGRNRLADCIIGKNDGNHWKYGSIVNHYRKIYAERLGETFTIKRIMSVNKG